MTIFTVWTKSEYESELLAIFSNELAAMEYARIHNGKVLKDIAFNSVEEEANFTGWED